MSNEIMPELSEYFQNKKLNIYLNFNVITIVSNEGGYKITGICQNEIIELNCKNYIDTSQEGIMADKYIEKNAIYRVMILSKGSSEFNINSWKRVDIGRQDIYILEKEVLIPVYYPRLREDIIDLLKKMKMITKDKIISCAESVEIYTEKFIYKKNTNYYLLCSTFPKNIFEAFALGEAFWRDYL